jgi:hypothetical protein
MAEKGRWGASPVRGHDDKWNLFMGKGMPSRVHFQGPHGVGRKKFAKDYHLTNNGGTADQEYTYDPNPTVQTITAMRAFAMLPPKNRFRTVTIELPEQIPDRVVSALVALLDDESPAKVILISTNDLPEALASRVLTFRFEPLSDEDIRLVLTDLQMNPERIERILKVAEGSVAKAKAARAYIREQELVLKLIDAILESDSRTITNLRHSWKIEHTTALRKWLQESLTGQWVRYEPIDDRPLSRPSKMALLKATARTSRGFYTEIRRVAEDIARGGTGA